MIDSSSPLQSANIFALDPVLVIAVSCLIGITMVTLALLRAWQDWVALKRRELERAATSPIADETDQLSVGAARIELADLRERIKKLEAIASGVEL